MKEPEQLGLLGLEPALPPFTPEPPPGRKGRASRYDLFFALCPSPELAAGLARLGADLRNRHGLQAEVLAAERLHLSLVSVAEFHATLPGEVMEATRAAAARVLAAPFTVAFDRALSFQHSEALVLRCDAASDQAVAALRGSLARQLRQAGLKPQASGTPHLSLLYNAHLVAEHPVEAPPWTVTGFSLVLSHVGQSYHQRLGDWPLRGMR